MLSGYVQSSVMVVFVDVTYVGGSMSVGGKQL